MVKVVCPKAKECPEGGCIHRFPHTWEVQKMCGKPNSYCPTCVETQEEIDIDEVIIT